MEGVPPSERVRREIDALLRGKTSIRSQGEGGQSLVLLAMRRVLQEVVEQEQADFVGRERYKHQAEGGGRRRGCEPKALRTVVGKVPLEVP